MRQDNIVCLAAIRRRMQAKFQFKNRNQAFENFWYGWTQKRIRATGVHPASYRQRWIRGYLKSYEAQDFWNYIIE